MVFFESFLNFEVYLKVAFCIFLLGIAGVFVVRRHLIIILMSLEMILFAVNLNFIIYSAFLDDITGQFFALVVLTVAASESALGLAILVIYYRLRGVIDLDYISFLKG